MTPKLIAMIPTALGPLVAAVLVDLHGYLDAKAKDPHAKFDWGLASIRYAIGLVTGIMAVLGISTQVS